jgi:sarcosine oxidase
MSSSFDVIVVGVGGMGSAACCELARRGRHVLGLEQFSLGHDRGSSHGQTRIIRTAYFEHPDYVPLVRRSFEGWYDLEQRQGRHLLTECGCLTIGRPESVLVQGVRASAEQHGLPVEHLSPTDLHRRFPPFQFPPDYLGILERSAGFLAVEQCVLAHAREAQKLGAVLHAGEAVFDWQVGGGGVTVRTSAGRYSAARLVLTAGPWAGRLLAGRSAPLTVMRQVAQWFGTRDDRRFRRDVFPLFIADVPAGYFYGFPVVDTALGLKVAQHYGAAELSDPDAIARTATAEDEAAVRGFLNEHLPDVDGPVRHASVCTYTLTPDRHFLIDRHPDHPEVVFAAGFSGHGFKFAPVIGEILADLVEVGRTDWPLELFKLSRFRTRAAALP